MMRFIMRFIAIIAALSFCLSSAFAQDEAKRIFANHNQIMPEKHPLIPIEIFLPNKTLPRYQSKNLNISSSGISAKNVLPTHLDLTEYLGVLGAERDQGNCGSCWVWSGIGCLEAQFNKALIENKFNGVNYVKNQKFSLNFIEGKLLRHRDIVSYYSSICDGGRPEWLTDLLQTDDGYNYLVPKSNRNANATFSGLKSENNTTRTLENIQTTPHVNINKIQLLDVVTDYNNPEQEKLEVMQALNDGYLVQLDYFVYPDFYAHWNNNDEKDQYFFTNKPGEGYIGGHAVVIVGYDTSDPDPNKHYWIAQNSWGVTDNRPNGQFRVNINSSFGEGRAMEYVIYKADLDVEQDSCDNLDNDCNTVVDDGCNDLCPDDPEKTVPGICGCDESDFDSDFDGAPVCADGCPMDPQKIEPGICGCGAADDEYNIADDDGDGIINCLEDDFLKYRDVKIAMYYRTGKTYLCASSKDGKLFCLGDNYFGTLGTGDQIDTNKLTEIKSLSGVSTFDLGLRHACAVAKDQNGDNKVFCWGANVDGDTGIYNPLADHYIYLDQFTPQEIELDIPSPVSCTAGHDSTCVTSSNGKTYCFGSNTGGKLGLRGSMYDGGLRGQEWIGTCVPNEEYNDGKWKYNGEYAEVPLDDITAIEMKSYETASVSNGTVYTYGIHPLNQKRYLLDARYDEFKDVKAISMSETDLCAITNDSKLYCSDMFVMSPHLTRPRDIDPMNLIDLENVSKVVTGSDLSNVLYINTADKYGGSCGPLPGTDGKSTYTLEYLYPFGDDPESHICAISNGDLYCWGRGNSYGQLGSDRKTDLNIPVKVEGASKISSLTSSGALTCYISGGEIYCFGYLGILGLDGQTSVPCKLSRPGGKTADIIQAGDSCTYIDDTCGHYSYKNGNLVCRPCSEDVEYKKAENDFDSCYENMAIPAEEPTTEPTAEPTIEPTAEPTIEPTAEPTIEPTIEPTPTPNLCPPLITTSISVSKVSRKKIKVKMEAIDKTCFPGNYQYEIKLTKNGKRTYYKSKKPVFITKKLKKGKYKVSYRVMLEVKKATRKGKKVKVRKVYSFITGYTKQVRVTIK